MTMLRRKVLKALAIFLAATLIASCDPFGLRDVLEAASRSALSLDPTDVVVPSGATLAFTANGGVPPYAWSVLSGIGSIDVATGEYHAPLTTGGAVVRVSDATGATADTGVTVEALVTGLAITPSAITVTVNAEVQFGAVGGTGSYTYDFAGTGSGSPGLNTATGYYVAGSTPGTDVVRVSDGASPPDTCTVTVVALNSAVDYSVTSTAGLPSSAVAGDPIGGGLTFTLANTGPGDGSTTVSWKVYLSNDATLAGGDVVVTEGISGPLAAGGTNPVGLGGTWPSGPIGPGYLIVTVSAADDTSPGNNTSAAAAFALDPRPVDYDVTLVSHTAGTFTGEPVTGSFTVQNLGTAMGAASFSWFVYASTDTGIDAGDYLLQSGTHAVLAPSESQAIGIASTWPATAASYYLLVRVSAADDVASGNDADGIAVAVDVTGSPPANIDYHAAAPVNGGPTVAGGAMSGTFQVSNGGTAPGSQLLYWWIYRSTDSTLDVGIDEPIAWGSRAGLAPTPPNPATTVPYSGTWPAGAGTWYLFAIVSSGDDVDPLDNDSGGTMVTITAPVVDYVIDSFDETSTPVAGDPIAGTLQIRNAGTGVGAQTVTWTVYRSPDATLVPAGDLVVDAGSFTGRGPGVSSGLIVFDGTWPATPAPPWTWRLYLVAEAADEVDPLDNTSGTLTRTTQPPNADYDVVSVSNTGGTVTEGSLTGSFMVTNLGPHDGTQAIPWRAYLSADPSYDAGVDTLIDSGVIPSPGLAESTSGGAGFAGTWAQTTGPWYLVVVLDAGDDPNAANDWGASGSVTLTVPNVNYTVISGANTGGTIAGGAMDAEFTIKNLGTDTGSRTVYWKTYRSDDPTLTIGVDPEIASGSTAWLGPSGTATIPFTNVWPAALSPKTYYLFVRVLAADDVLATDDTSAPLAVLVNPPNVDYDVVSISNTGALAAGGVQSGSLEIRNIGTVSGSRTVSWFVYRSLDLVFVEGSDPVIASGSIPGGLPFNTSAFPTFTGTWPEDTVPHIYYYYVKIIVADDINGGNDDEYSPGYLVNPPASVPDYRVVSPVFQPTGTPGAPLAGVHSFCIQNTVANPGTKPIAWRVYASTDDVLDGLDTLISVGSIGALGASDTSTTISYGGNWPAMGSWYRLIVSVTAADDPNPANDRWTSGATSVLEMAYTEALENNSGIGPWPGTLSTSSLTGIVMSEGRYVQIDGTFDAKNNYDTYKLQFGPTTTRIQIVVTWATGTDAIDFYFWDETGQVGQRLELDPDVETVTYIDLTPGGTWYVGVSFIGTTSFTGQPYQMTWYAEPD